ncbi:orotate phosphoribosyltransferase [candidate division CSSED10-310 bacterium]|uniref:Orotate phosphoribosyltransferase n=1 Tax=candidate division CSSED10-310 bacterium TaxID=2855610 RepID=A0ABV6YTE6_UNCC1
MVAEYQKDFIEFLLANNALRFGEFTLKSGRKSPYFINTGQFYSGVALAKLASFYAAALQQNEKDDFTIIFGPAYKGIPLCVSLAYYYGQQLNRRVCYLFDRKEAKVHGEFGADFRAQNYLVGKIPTEDDKVLLIDDVLTTGGTKYEAVELLHKISDTVPLIGLIISVDRQEVDQNGDSPVQLFYEKTNIPVISIITIETIISYLKQKPEEFGPYLDSLMEYRRQWGIPAA